MPAIAAGGKKHSLKPRSRKSNVKGHLTLYAAYLPDNNESESNDDNAAAEGNSGVSFEDLEAVGETDSIEAAGALESYMEDTERIITPEPVNTDDVERVESMGSLEVSTDSHTCCAVITSIYTSNYRTS